MVVGAERAEEFAYATHVASRGNQVMVVNPKMTSAARRYQKGGGNFVKKGIEELPKSSRYQIIREDFPVPLPGYPPTAEFVAQRLTCLAPGGRWVIVTESEEFVRAIRAAAETKGTNTFIRRFPKAHDASPKSKHPKETSRFTVIVEKPL